MPKILTFPKHRLYRCDGHCEQEHCPYCDGGLSYCPTCGGAEGSLPEDCPQRRMTDEEEKAVYRGELDFRVKLGGWTTWTRAREMAIRTIVMSGEDWHG